MLFVSSHLPWPPISGGRRRELELITRLRERFRVRLVVVSKTPEEDQANVREVCSTNCAVEVFPALVPNARAADNPPAHQIARHRSPAASRRIREILTREPVDLVHVEGFYLMQHVPAWVEVPVLLVEQNVEYELDRQRAHAGGARVTRLDSFFESIRTHSAECSSWQRATRLATVTWEDREMIRAEVPGVEVSVVPDGADHLATRPTGSRGRACAVERPKAPLLTLLANFAYAPNVDAALHFCHDILPSIRAVVEDVHVWLVGNAPPPEIERLAEERISVTGYVTDVVPYFDASDVILCPLRIGGGIKVKMIEALRRGKAIVSTAIGAQGLPHNARDALVVADDPAEFARAVVTLLRDEQRRVELEHRAADVASSLPTWDESAAALSALYEELLERAAGRRASRADALVRSQSTGRSA